MARKKQSFEEAIKRLQDIVEHLEKGDLSLQESVSIFEEGNDLVRECSRILDEAQQKVVMLRAGKNGEAEEVFFEESTNA